MQIAPADPQLARRLQLVSFMHAQCRAHQFPLASSNRFMERAFRYFLRTDKTLQLLWQIFHSQTLIAIGQHQAAFDYVLQLAHVTRPAMPSKGVQEAQTQSVELLVVRPSK